MTAVTIAPAFTLDDAKDAAIAVLDILVDAITPDTYECQDCVRSTLDLCPDHGEARARQQRLTEAVADVRRAGSAEQILAILAAASGTEDTNGGN